MFHQQLIDNSPAISKYTYVCMYVLLHNQGLNITALPDKTDLKIFFFNIHNQQQRSKVTSSLFPTCEWYGFLVNLKKLHLVSLLQMKKVRC